MVLQLLAHSPTTIHLDDGSVTAAELAVDGRGLARAFHRRGLEPGDRVALWCANGRPYLQVLAGVAAARLVLVSVNTRFSPEEARSIIERSGARLLVTDQPSDGRPPGLAVVPASEVARLVAEGDELPAEADATTHDPDDPYAVFTTSGTTSKPKLVLHTQRSIVDHARDVPGPFGYDDQTRMLLALPLCGVFGLCCLTASVAAGADVWLPSRFEAEAASALVAGHRIDTLNAPDDMIHRMLATGHDLSSLDLVGYGRFNSSLTDIVERAEAAGVNLTGLYGMSEVQALFLLQDPTLPTPLRARPGGALVSKRAEARVVDPETGEPVPIGGDGELQLRGPSLFVGYLAEGGAGVDPELTASAHAVDQRRGRWFRTGDLARPEDDGTYTFLTRMGDVLRLGGFLVAPAEIEDVLITCDGIAEAQVVAVARPEGVRPVAVVIADGPVDVDGVKARCAARLARYKVPIDVIEVSEFPVTASANGTKIQRNRLQQLAEASLRAGREAIG